MANTSEEQKQAAILGYRKKLLEHKESETKLRAGICTHTIFPHLNLARESVKNLKKDYEKTEDDLKALQSVGQIIGEVLKQLDEERCML